MRVTVLGAGYVGLVSGACLAKCGHDVLVCDVNADRIAMLNSGVSPIFEPGLDDLIKERCASGKLRFSTTCDRVGDDIVMIAVGTPPTPIGAADLSQVRAAVDNIAATAVQGTGVVMKSTVPPGTGRMLSAELAERGIWYASNPEFLREGSAIKDFFETDRIVVGASSESAAATLRELYAQVDAPIVECDITSAEMVKYASNAFLATKISFINEIASLCDRVGADIDAVSTGIGQDTRIGASFLNAGIGYGGSCFPKDTRALDFLAAAQDYDFRLLKAVIEVNMRQRILPVSVLRQRLGDLVGKRIALLGFAFKPHTDDTRESPALDVISMLASEGATVIAHDPVAALPAATPATQAATVAEALLGADACIVAVEWPEYVALDWGGESATLKPGAVVFDGRNCIEPAPVRAAGLVYVGVGRGADAV